MKRIALMAIVLTAWAAAAPAGPADLKAFYRDGQTFITWKEDPAAAGAWYRVYAAEAPIGGDNLAKAVLMGKVPSGSNHWGFFRNVDTTKGFFKDLADLPWAKAIQIEDDEAGAKMLPDGTGLLVLTAAKDAKRYYAVTLEKDGQEDKTVAAGVNSLKAAVEEKVAPPGAVLQRKLGDRYYIYAFFCDYALWNPDGKDDNWDGYAHVFHIRAPAADRKDTKEPYPVSFRLHAFGAWPDWNIPYCYPATHVDVHLLDYHLTWWYGHNDNLPAVDPKTKLPAPGTVVNFTERRVVQVARWLMRSPSNLPFKVDPACMSIFGGSMGGTGTHTIGVRNGDVFAGAFADEGIFNWGMDPKQDNWLNDVRGKYGPFDRNDKTNEGPGVYDVLNLPKFAAEHPERELPFMSIGQGSMDFVIPFFGFPEYLKALEAGKHPFAASWEVAGHSPWVGSNSPMDYKRIRRDEVIPAFANASCNTPLKSGFRISAALASVSGKTLKIAPGAITGPEAVNGKLPPNLAGMKLLLGPTGDNKSVFTVASSTDTEITVAEGDLESFLPPLTTWDIHVLKQQITKAEGKDREPTDAEKKAVAERNKKSFLITDGMPRGCWNGHFAWSTAEQNFDAKGADDDIVDEAGKLAICIRLVKHPRDPWTPDKATADVTPRRAQKFKPAAGEKVHWENWDCSDPAKATKIAEGDATADKHGLVTVEKFAVSAAGWGNKLVMTRKP